MPFENPKNDISSILCYRSIKIIKLKENIYIPCEQQLMQNIVV